MLLEVTDVNFFSTEDWIFKFKSTEGQTVFAMNERFYHDNRLKFPLDKQHLDNYDVGMKIEADIINIKNIYVIVNITQFMVQ